MKQRGAEWTAATDGGNLCHNAPGELGHRGRDGALPPSAGGEGERESSSAVWESD